MNKRRITLPTALMLMILAVVTTFNITFFVATDYYNARLDALEELETRYSKLKTVADLVEKHFVADYSEQEAIEYALSGYVTGLGDQWSGYYTAEQTAAIEEDDANAYVGIGVTYSLEESSKYRITSVIAGGPADQAGMLAGDVLMSANGIDVTTLATADELADIVKGEAGTTVTIVVNRGQEQLTFTITRATVQTYSVTSTLLEGGVGYIAVADFDRNVDVEVATHLQQLQEQGAKGFIFDMRNNPGGYLEVMRSILDTLLPEGVVITTVDKAGNETSYTSDKDLLGAPLVVLTNEYSISAAEFFAAAVQEYDVGTVVGEKTSGKGYSQQLFKLQDGSSVNISTTRYYTPKGNSLAETGVTPDQVVEMTQEDLYALSGGQLDTQQDVHIQAALQVLAPQIAALAAEEAPAE